MIFKQICIDLNKEISLEDITKLEQIENVNFKFSEDICTVAIVAEYNGVFGMGECFDSPNQMGKIRNVHVREKFCNQGEFSYCPIPFFFTDTGFGVYADTMAISRWDFTDGIKISLEKDSEGIFPKIYVFSGSPKNILKMYSEVVGFTNIPPKWSLGTWMSANRWNSQKIVEEQLLEYDKHKIPADVVVLEAWSDEATFYLWNEEKWPNPEGMQKNMKKRDLKLVLWQIPVLKKLDPNQLSKTHDDDCAYAIENGLCAHNSDGSPYLIPDGNWFGGSMIPDFTNPKTVEWWFEKRKHLTNIGVSGFKTDGGEFVYTDDVKFHDGTTGIEMKNGYAHSYVKAYAENIGDEQILFSRAGYTGQQKYPIQWAGDQQSTWEEFEHVVSAGLSAGLSGVSIWTFDIAGFAGPFPDKELFERAVQMAAFIPAMQWHSEPVGGQFAEIMPSAYGINDRSPWNIANVYFDSELIERVRFHFNLHSNLMPYFFDLVVKSSKNGLPIMKHLILEYPDDKNVIDINNAFMLGDVLIYPLIKKGEINKKVYLPFGEWFDLWTGEKYLGNKYYELNCDKQRIPSFVRSGGCIALNLDNSFELGSYVGNSANGYKELCFFIAGNEGDYLFSDDIGNKIQVIWDRNKIDTKVLSGQASFQVVKKFLYKN